MEPETARQKYTVIAPRYDKIVRLSAKAVLYPLEHYRRMAVETLSLRAGDTALDIGCGTGLNFRRLEERIGPSGKLIGLDYTPAMLEQAARKAKEHGWQNVELIQGDAAEVARLVRGPVDGALSTACLCIVPGWEQAIAGAASLLRPGGRLVVLDFLSMKPRGVLAAFYPLVKWWTERYGFADPQRDFAEPRPWRETMEKHLPNVSYQEMYLGTMFLCRGEKG